MGYFHPDPWRFMIQFDEHIFQMGWFNHQLVHVGLKCKKGQSGEKNGVKK